MQFRNFRRMTNKKRRQQEKKQREYNVDKRETVAQQIYQHRLIKHREKDESADDVHSRNYYALIASGAPYVPEMIKAGFVDPKIVNAQLNRPQRLAAKFDARHKHKRGALTSDQAQLYSMIDFIDSSMGRKYATKNIIKDNDQNIQDLTNQYLLENPHYSDQGIKQRILHHAWKNRKKDPHYYLYFYHYSTKIKGFHDTYPGQNVKDRYKEEAKQTQDPKAYNQVATLGLYGRRLSGASNTKVAKYIADELDKRDVSHKYKNAAHEFYNNQLDHDRELNKKLDKTEGKNHPDYFDNTYHQSQDEKGTGQGKMADKVDQATDNFDQADEGGMEP